MDIWERISDEATPPGALAASGRGARIDAVSGAGQPTLAAWLGR